MMRLLSQKEEIGLLGKVEIEGVEISIPKRPLAGRLPFTRMETFSRIEATLGEMAEEAPPHLWFETFARDQLFSFVANSPSSVNIASAVCCSGAGVGTTNTTVYFMERAAAYSPDDFNRRYGHYPNIYVAGSPQRVVMVMKGPSIESLGRANGDFGWDSTRDLVAFALASFRHNFQTAMVAYKGRGHIPTTEPWMLPNLVIDPKVVSVERVYRSYIVEPPQAIPPASYTYRMWRPALVTRFTVGFKSPTPAVVGFDIWGSDKSSLARVEGIEVPKGDNQLTVLVRGAPRTGFLNVECTDAPEGLTVASVDMRPMSF